MTSRGWGTQESALLIGEHPDKRGKEALLLQISGQSFLVAEFVGPEAAEHVADWLDVAFNSAREMNQQLLQRAQEHGLLSDEEVHGWTPS